MEQVRRATEFEQQVCRVYTHLLLYRAYTFEEISHACERVCSHYPYPSSDTMGVLLIGDQTVTRDFIGELAKERL